MCCEKGCVQRYAASDRNWELLAFRFAHIVGGTGKADACSNIYSPSHNPLSNKAVYRRGFLSAMARAKMGRSTSTSSSDIHVGATVAPLVEVRNGRLLVIRLGKELLSTIFDDDDDDDDGGNSDQGRNARGTYAKEY